VKAKDVIAQLMIGLARFSSRFTDNHNVKTISGDGSGVIDVTTESEHDLEIGKTVSISGVTASQAVSSFTRSGTIGTITTTAPHDVTMNITGGTTISTDGADDAEFNLTDVKVYQVPDKNTLRVKMVDSGPTTTTGTIFVFGASSFSEDVNGLYSVTTVTNKYRFTFQSTSTQNGVFPNTSNVVARTQPRVSGSIDIDSAVAAYTEQGLERLWANVSINNTVSSQDRKTQTDAITDPQPNTHWRQRIVQNVSVHLFIPTAEYLSAREAADIAQEEFRNVCRSILGRKFDSQLYVGDQQGLLHFVNGGIFSYNGSVYVHEFNFGLVTDITFNDTWSAVDDDVAVRLISFEFQPDFGTGDSPMVTDNIVVPLESEGDPIE